MKKLGKLFLVLALFLGLTGLASCKRTDYSDAELEKIEITSQADKVEFFAGDELDTAGLEVTAFYSDGTKKEVENWRVTGFDSTILGEQTITVTYTEDDVTKTTSYKVTVKAVTLDKIEITTKPAKTEYYVGDTLDTTGLVVTATYNNGKTEDVTAKAEFTGFDSRYATEKLTVTAAYGGKTATFTVKILFIELTSIKITKEPAKKVYYLKDSFDATGLEVTAYYNNGTNKVLKENEYATNFNSSTAVESKTVEVTYYGQKALFTVKIIGEKEIKITKDATNKTVYQYQNADYTGLEVTLVYDDGTEKVLPPSNYTLTCDTTKTGSNTVTVTYGQKTVSYAVTMVALDSISVTTPPTKTNYYWDTDTALDTTELAVSRKYTDNKTEVLPATEYTVTGFDITNKQQQTITVTYKNKTTSFYVTVHDSTIEVTTPPAKTNYYWDTDTALDTTDLVITEKYDDNTTKPLTADDYSLTGFDITNKQQQTITVTYKNKTASFNVTVHDSTIEVTTPPTKTEYYIGDSINLAGAVVTETYDDGTTKTINNSDLAVTGFDSSEPEDNQQVTIIYKEKTVYNMYVKIIDFWYQTPKPLPAGTNGTYGTEGTYVYFGVWPQNVVPEDEVEGLNLDEEATTTIERGYLKYVKGNDGNYYVKCAEKAYNSGYKYNKDNSDVGQGGTTSRWFKVMPIKWRVVDTAYDVDGTNGNNTAKLLVAENILTANVPYYEDDQNNRIIESKTVYPNNYMHSQIRAYLNGLSYQGQSEDQTQWESKGFLQTAFTVEAAAKILTTRVDNSEGSTTNFDTQNGTVTKATDYACDPTDDKIFLISEYEVTKYSKEVYSSSDNSRIRVTTDFAKANNAYQNTTNDYGGYWWLRSPACLSSSTARYVYCDGSAGGLDIVNSAEIGVVPALSISF